MRKMWMVVFALAGLMLCLSGVSVAQEQVAEEWRALYEGASSDWAYDIAVDAYGDAFVTGQAVNPENGTYDILTIKYDAQSGVERWRAWYNGSANRVDEGKAIAVDDLGNVYVVGHGDHYYDFPNYSQDIVVLKYDNNGIQTWAKTYNSAWNLNDNAKALALALEPQGNVYVTGSSDTLFYNQQLIDVGWVTIAYSSSGTRLWHHFYNHNKGSSVYPDGEAPSDIAVDYAGYVYVTGKVHNPSVTNYDWATLRYTGGGGPDWERFYSGTPTGVNDYSKALAVDASGNVVVTGTASTSPLEWTTIKYDRSGNSVWPQPSRIENGDGVDVVTNVQGDVFVLGGYAADYATAKLRAGDGATLWFKKDGDPSVQETPQELALDGLGDVYITGTNSNSDYWTVKHRGDDFGDKVWDIAFDPGGAIIGRAEGLALDPARNVYVTGIISSNNSDYATVKYNQNAGGFAGAKTDSSNGRHLVRDPWTGELHLVMHRVTDNAILYSKSTDGGYSWGGLTAIGTGLYPTVGVAQTGPGYVVIGVAYKRIVPGGGYKLSYRWLDPFGVWHASVDISTSSNPGPPSLVMSNGWAYVAYKSGAAVLCSRFDCTNPAGFLTEAIDATSGPTQPCLAVDGNGAVYAAWRRTTGSYANQIWYCPRGTSSPYWNPTNKLRVDQSGDPSQQPFVECYGDSVFVAWSDGQPSPSDVWRAAKSFSDIQWQYTNVSLIPGGSPASESPTQAWREFTTWSEWSPGPQPDIYYWRPSGMKDVVEPNPNEWSYWTHSQMQYPDPGFSTDLWSAWTESPNPNAPPYRVLTKHQSFLFFGPGLGSELSDYGNYYKVLAGQDSASRYCRKRDGVLRFQDKAVDFARDSLVYELPYLDPVYDYYLRVASYRETGNDWAQALSVDGGPSRAVHFAPNVVDTAWVRIPPEAYERDRKVSFSLKNMRGDYVTGLSLTLFQRDPKGRGKGGPQAGKPVAQPVMREVFAVYPNPMKNQVQIEYSLKAPGEAGLTVYDVMGRLVRKVVEGRQPAGVHRAIWDGKSESGKLAPGGVYFLRLNTPERTKTARLVLVR